MSVGKNAFLAGAGLAVLEASTGGLGGGMVSLLAENIASSANAIVTGAASAVDPYFSSSLIPAGLAGWSVWDGSEKYSEKGVLGMIEKSAWNYGILGGLGTAAGLISAPIFGTALAVGGGLMAARHIVSGTKEFANDPIGNIGAGLSAPFRWTGNAFSSLRGRGAASA